MQLEFIAFFFNCILLKLRASFNNTSKKANIILYIFLSI